MEHDRASLKADLRNARTLLGLLDGGAVVHALEQVVHDVTVGRRTAAPLALDLAALRAAVEQAAPAAARAHRVADDTLAWLVRALDRVLSWWPALPVDEPLLDDARWAETSGPTLELAVSAGERDRVRGLPGTWAAVGARFEKYLSKCPHVVALRLVDPSGEVVAVLAAERGAARLAG